MNPSGPHPVGVADLAARNAGPGVERLAARLFYPCQRAWTLPCTWIPHINYARGYIGYVFKMVQRKTWKTELAKSALISAAWALGGSRVLPVYYNALATSSVAEPVPLPVVIFSHGLAGTRNAYSSICIELASRGYVVMALEHSDGSASCARLPRLPAAAAATTATAAPGTASDDSSYGGAGNNSIEAAAPGDSEWCFYMGLGDKAEQLRKTQHRVAEVAAAYRLLEQLHHGGTATTLSSSGGSSGSGTRTAVTVHELPALVAESLRGRLDLQRVAVAGHSYGGATAAAAAASLPYIKAAVSLDPWWDCFDDSWPVLTRWMAPSRAPLLVIGSDDWNTPSAQGKLKCGGENQERVLRAASAGGGGAVLVVPRGSTHTNFDDVMLLFGKSLSVVLRLLNIRSSLEPQRAHQINMWCITHFLSKHLPPPPYQQLQHQHQHQQREGKGTEDAAAAASSAPSLAAAEGPGGNVVCAPRPVSDGDLQAYVEAVGNWLAISRLVPGGR